MPRVSISCAFCFLSQPTAMLGDDHVAAKGGNADAGAFSPRLRQPLVTTRWGKQGRAHTENSPLGCDDVVVGPPPDAVVSSSCNFRGEHPTPTEHSSLKDIFENIKCDACGMQLLKDAETRGDIGFYTPHPYPRVYCSVQCKAIFAPQHGPAEAGGYSAQDGGRDEIVYTGMGGGTAASSGPSPPQVSGASQPAPKEGATQPAESPPIGCASAPFAQLPLPCAPPCTRAAPASARSQCSARGSRGSPHEI